MHNEDDRNYSQLSQFISIQLVGQFGKNYFESAPIAKPCSGQDILRQGVNRATFRFATNFCFSASNMPCLATMYPGSATHTTSITASNTSNMRWPRAGWDSWSFARRANRENVVVAMEGVSLPAITALSRKDVGLLKRPIL